MPSHSSRRNQIHPKDRNTRDPPKNWLHTHKFSPHNPAYRGINNRLLMPEETVENVEFFANKKPYSLEEAINEEMEEADAILAANAAKKAVKLEKAVEMEILLEKWLLRLPMTPIEHCEYLHWAAEMARS